MATQIGIFSRYPGSMAATCSMLTRPPKRSPRLREIAASLSSAVTIARIDFTGKILVELIAHDCTRTLNIRDGVVELEAAAMRIIGHVTVRDCGIGLSDRGRGPGTSRSMIARYYHACAAEWGRRTPASRTSAPQPTIAPPSPRW